MRQSAGYSPVPVPDHHDHHDHHESSDASVGFPVGTGMLLIVIFSMSGIFSCCYHCDKFRSLRHSLSDDTYIEAALQPNHHLSHPSISKPHLLSSLGNKQKEKEKERERLGVIMPGDAIPKFIALPMPMRCPCQPLRPPTAINS